MHTKNILSRHLHFHSALTLFYNLYLVKEKNIVVQKKKLLCKNIIFPYHSALFEK